MTAAPRLGVLWHLLDWLKASVRRQRAVLPGPDYRSDAEKRIDEAGAGHDEGRVTVASIRRSW